MLGKHYQVQPDAGKLKRQYTICNAMSQGKYFEWIQVARDALKCKARAELDQVTVDPSLFDEREAREVSLTIKNYGTAHGLSSMVFNPSKHS